MEDFCPFYDQAFIVFYNGTWCDVFISKVQQVQQSEWFYPIEIYA